MYLIDDFTFNVFNNNFKLCTKKILTTTACALLNILAVGGA